MILQNCSSLALAPLVGTWYRAVRPQYLATVLHSRHTTTVTSRFSSGSRAHPQFEILYLTDNPITALFEVYALLGSLHGPNVPNPQVFFTVVSVQVALSYTADLTDPTERRRVRTSVQELTGDWLGYTLRNPKPSAPPQHYSCVPTQRLGYELHRVPGLEGFKTYSAKVPTATNLVLFPRKLDPSSSVRCYDPNTGQQIDQIPGPRPPSVRGRRKSRATGAA